MWKVIQDEMKGRSVILTTHMMEEADVLCHRIGIMVNGRLACIGSSQHLKSRFGDAYQIEIRTLDRPESIDKVKQLLTGMIEGTSILEDFAGRLRFSVPKKQVHLSQLFSLIENARTSCDIKDYVISQTT